MGLELHVEFNKGAVMVLPSGTTKRTGLAAALEDMRLSPHSVVGVGDAENDHTFLSFCECAVSVANALPSLKLRSRLGDPLRRGQGRRRARRANPRRRPAEPRAQPRAPADRPRLSPGRRAGDARRLRRLRAGDRSLGERQIDAGGRAPREAPRAELPAMRHRPRGQSPTASAARGRRHGGPRARGRRGGHAARRSGAIDRRDAPRHPDGGASPVVRRDERAHRRAAQAHRSSALGHRGRGPPRRPGGPGRVDDRSAPADLGRGPHHGRTGERFARSAGAREPGALHRRPRRRVAARVCGGHGPGAAPSR